MRKWILVLSLMMNLLLAIGIVKNLSNVDKKKEIISDAGLSAVSVSSKQNELDDKIPTSKLQVSNPENEVETPTWWPQVPSHDYQQLKQAMISVGCPDPVIHDVITPLIYRDYWIRLGEIYSKMTPFSWLLDRPLMDSEMQHMHEELGSIQDERDRLIEELNPELIE